MKKTLIALLSVVGTALPSMSQGVSDTESGVIKNYFSSVLGGTWSAFSSDTKVSLSEIAASQEAVWDIWKQANDEFVEEKLPNKLYPYEDQFQKSWQLPGDLEPHAVMPFVMGYKGKSTEPRPLFIFLHGSGPKDDEWLSVKRIAKDNDDEPAAYFIPQIPNGGYVGGITYYRWYQKAKQWAWEKLIRQINLRANLIDINKLYFIGISEGAYGSQRLGSFYADYLAGIGPMAGGEPINNAPVENLRNTAVHFRTGSLDTSYFRASLTQAFSDSISRLQSLNPDGYDHDVALIINAGHTIPYGAATPWLITKTRQPYPKHVSWEDFEMDGNWRKGFHNIQILRRDYANTTSRMYYEMDIEDNNIDMRVRSLYYNYTSQSGNLVLDFDRIYSTVVSGAFRIYLNNELVDLSREVTLTVNGKQIFKGVLQPTLENMVNSCALYFDRMRVYPVALDVNLDNMTADGELSGIGDIFCDADDDTPMEYFNLQGIRVEHPQSGIYIRRQGDKVDKVVIR